MIDWWAKFTYWFGNQVNTNYSGVGIMLSTELDERESLHSWEEEMGEKNKERRRKRMRYRGEESGVEMIEIKEKDKKV